MQFGQPFLDVYAGSHVLRRTNEHTDFSGPHVLEHGLFLGMGLIVAHPRHLRGRNASLLEPSHHEAAQVEPAPRSHLFPKPHGGEYDLGAAFYRVGLAGFRIRVHPVAYAAAHDRR